MTSAQFAPKSGLAGRPSLAEIDRVVSARLGATPGLGNSQPACFNRQVAMYLAKYVGGWSTTVIGRFYNGRDHSTVCYGIQRIESLRESDPDVDALVIDLTRQLRVDQDACSERTPTASEFVGKLPEYALDELVNSIVERHLARLREKTQNGLLALACGCPIERRD